MFCFSSCDKTEELEEHTPEKENRLLHKHQAPTTSSPEYGQAVLGKKLNNPYSVSNMNIALEALRKYQPGIVPPNFTVSTTHYYVKFFVESEEDTQALEAQKLELFPYPLDYEIDQDIDYTLAADENAVGKWLYTSVPFDFDFNSTQLQYEMLEDLFLEDPAGIPVELECEEGPFLFFEVLESVSEITTALVAPGGSSPASPPADVPPICTLMSRRSKERPEGFVTVWDSERGQFVPVVGVRVRTRRWFKYGYDYTDENGYYEVDETYRRNPKYSVIFRNESGFKIWSSVVAMQRAEHNVGRHNKRGYDIEIPQSSRGWRFATVNNATVKYRDYCTQFGIGRPPRDLRIVVSNNDIGNSAPMMKRVYGGIGFNTNSQAANFFLHASGITLSITAIYNVIRFASPDITLGGNSSQGTTVVYRIAFHELAHASHYENVGNTFWTAYIRFIMTFGAYGDGEDNDADLCALSEAWANHISFRFLLEEYNGVGGTADNSHITWDGFENFTSLPTGDEDDFRRFNRIGGTIVDWEGWIPCGLMQDIVDNNVDIIRPNEGTIVHQDNVEGYSHRELYEALGNTVQSPQAFRDRLLLNSNDRDRTDMIALFIAYRRP